MDETETNGFVSVIAIFVLIVTALFIFSTGYTEAPVSVLGSGRITESTGGNTSTFLSHANCSYRVWNSLDTNSTTVAGVVQETFVASRWSLNLTYGIEFFFWFPYSPHQYPINVYMNATLTSVTPVQIYNYSFYDPGWLTGLWLNPPNDTRSFNNSSPEEYRFMMDWSVTITFINSSLSDAQFFCNVSFNYTFPDLVAVNLPSSLGYTSLIGAVIGVVVISMVFKAWNHPRVVDDSV